MIEEQFNLQAAAHDGKRPDRQIMNEQGEMIDDNSDNPRGWDVCVTTYEVCNTERKALQRFAWKYLGTAVALILIGRKQCILSHPFPRFH
jgi:SWI/SNF-related matrix-associated actin-dependent regulator of chromatin subfamily A member 5